MKEELYEAILEALFDRVGYKCQPSELEEIANIIVDLVREAFSEELT